MSILIVNNATIVTMNRDTEIWQAIRSSSRGVRSRPSSQPNRSLKIQGHKIIDGQDQFVFPGFINTHTHSLPKQPEGLGRDKLAFDWLDSSVRKALHEIRYADVYHAAVAGCIENIRSGATTVLDYMYAHASQTGLDDAVVQAFDETGIRGILGRAHTKPTIFPRKINVRSMKPRTCFLRMLTGW